MLKVIKSIDTLSSPFNEQITSAIKNSKAHPVFSISAKDRIIAGSWCIKDKEKNLALENAIFCKE